MTQVAARLGSLLRSLLASLSGEDGVEDVSDDVEDQELAAEARRKAAAEAMDREIELARLEKENEELRRMIGLLPPHRRESGMNGGGGGPLYRAQPRHTSRTLSSSTNVISR